MWPFAWISRHGDVAVAFLISLFFVVPPISAEQPVAQRDQLLPLTEFSPSLPGMYRKVMEIDSEIKRFTDQY